MKHRMGRVKPEDWDALARRERDGFAEEFDFMARTTAGVRYDLLLNLMPQGTDRALDAGCGTGLLTMHLARRVRQVVGLDISRSMIAVATTSPSCSRTSKLSHSRNIRLTLWLLLPPFSEPI